MDSDIVVPSSIPTLGINNSNAVERRDIRLCPICRSEIRPFFISFTQKILMCEKTDCEFPFGHEEVQYLRDDDMLCDTEASGTQSVSSPTRTTSIISDMAWSELNKLNAVFNENSQFDQIHDLRRYEDKNSEDPKKIEEIELTNNIQQIKDLNTMLMQETKKDDDQVQIKNKKWIKNLKTLQEKSGFQLLKPEEIGLLRKEEPVLGLGELKIDIDPGKQGHMSSIVIELHNREHTESLQTESQPEPVT